VALIHSNASASSGPQCPSVLAGKRGERRGDGGKVLDETSVPGGQAQKLSNLFYGLRIEPLCDGPDLLWIGSYIFLVDDMPEVFQLVHTEPTLVRVEAQLYLTKTAENFPQRI